MKWQTKWELGIPAIDEQHKMLIQMLEDIYDACSRGEGIAYIKEAISFLDWYVQKHFKDEENIQRKYHYPKFEEHKQIHTEYIKELTKLKREIQENDVVSDHIAKVIAYLDKMIKEHMQGHDKVLAHYLKHHEIYNEEEQQDYYERNELTGLITGEELEKIIQYKLKNQVDIFTYGILQIDGFNDVNRTYGYGIGNEVLIYVAGVLKEYETDKCMIAHTYQDEFRFYMDIDNPLVVDKTLERIRQKIYDGFKRKGSIIPLSVTMGITIAKDEQSVNDIIQKADIALGKAKRQGKNTKVYYDDTMHDEIVRCASIINRLQPHSLSSSLYVVYQPIFNLQTGTVKGCEALLRMKDEDGNVISPMEFIPLAEKNNLMADIGYFCVNEVCKAYRHIKCMYTEVQYISVNLSIYQLQDSQMVEKMVMIAKGHGIDLKNIYFELTESAIIENIKEVQKVISLLKEKGSKILLDDFGTGYSALSYLSQLDIDIIKIDKSFLRYIDTDPKAFIVLRDVIRLIRELNLTSVVEGVEKKEEMEKLKYLRADNIQGYYISRPVIKEDICSCIDEIKKGNFK